MATDAADARPGGLGPWPPTPAASTVSTPDKLDALPDDDHGRSTAASYHADPLSPDGGPFRRRPHRSKTTPVPGGTHTHTETPPVADDTEDPVAADTATPQPFPRISRPVELMRSAYDCVVIGSGYGGGVAAARMARAGQSVCVLELGKERWPGEYPVHAREALAELHVSGELAPEALGGRGLDVHAGGATGMYHLVLGKGQNAVVCNGLGGTSLINANIFLRADEATLAQEAWPPELRVKGALDAYYDKVEAVLEPEAYPADWPALPKLDLLQTQAERLGLGDRFYRPKQTTRFRSGPNSCGVEMAASTLTGQDCTGLNDGSKTTTLVTYLADAWNWGAELFCACEVRYVEKAADGGYRVFFAWHGGHRGAFGARLHADLMWVHAREAVFLGAGALGTTEILLRSQALGGLGLSPCVGQNMSGNGDMLAFGYNTECLANAVGQPDPLSSSASPPVGPTIAGVLDHRAGHANPLDGYVLEEGAVPHALAGVLQAMLDLLPHATPPPAQTAVHRAQAALARWGSRLLGPYWRRGAVERTQVYLVMSHDSNQAVLSLRDDKPVLEFLGVGRSGHVQHLNALLARATAAVGGTLVGNPFYALLGQQVTVHPIGGASLAPDNTGQTGAADHMGRLFTGAGSAVHEGLIVADGAAVPTALGVNPLATIAALAERSVDLYARARGLVVRTDPNGVLDLFGPPAHPHPTLSSREASLDDSLSSRASASSQGPTAYEEVLDEADDASVARAHQLLARAAHARAGGFGFAEAMSGFLHRTADADAHVRQGGDTRAAYEQAYRRAQSLCESARFFLSVQALDVRAVVRGADHRGLLTGSFVCPTLPGSPFLVQRGAFHLFVADRQAPGTRNLTYDFDLRGTDGRTLHFHGYKVVDASVALAPLQLWRATTTLYVTITRRHYVGPEPGADGGGAGLLLNSALLPASSTSADDAWRFEPVLARGILHIQPADFLSELLTLTPTGSGLLRKAASAARFLSFFARQSLGLFLAPLMPLQYPSPSYDGFVNPTPPTRLWTDVRAADGVCSRLYLWEPLPQYVRPGRGAPPSLLLVPGAAVDHQIFALPTIPFNAVNYFTRAGYRVFAAVHRIGQLAVAENGWTTYDARLDLRAALERIRAVYGDHPVYTVAHCMGSVALAAGLLDGTVPAAWLRGLTCSQVFMNPIWNAMTMIKARAGPVPLDALYRALAGPWFRCAAAPDGALAQRLLDQALRLAPDARRELCSSATCHRASLVFGRCWNHANLNEATHRQIDRFFGGVNTTLLHLLMRQGREGHVLANGPAYEVLTTPANVARRLRGLPVFLFVGADNAVLSPRATEKTYEILCDTFGPAAQQGADYRRRVVPGYGHLDCWMGRHAWRDVYPLVRAEVDRVVHGDAYVFQEPDAAVCRFTRMMEAGAL